MVSVSRSFSTLVNLPALRMYVSTNSHPRDLCTVHTKVELLGTWRVCASATPACVLHLSAIHTQLRSAVQGSATQLRTFVGI